MTGCDPLAFRPNPNTRYETVSEAVLVQLGKDIIRSKAEIGWLEMLSKTQWVEPSLLTEWRKTLRLLLIARKRAQRAAQGRLFDNLDGWS